MRKMILVLALLVLFNLAFSQGEGEGDVVGGVFDQFSAQPEVWNFVSVPQGQVDNKGDLNLSIPIMTVPGRGGMNFDIKFNYHAPITKDQRATWIGLGWSCNADANVNRDVQGGINGYPGVDFGNIVSTQPDLYYLTLPGEGTCAFSRSNRDWSSNLTNANYLPVNSNNFHFHKWKPWKIDVDTSNTILINNFWRPHNYLQSNANGNVNEIDRFIITKDDGTRYILSKKTIAWYMPQCHNGEQYVSAWRLEAILSADYPGIDLPEGGTPGNWIRFYYRFDASNEYKTDVVGSEGKVQRIVQNTFLWKIQTPTHTAEFLTSGRVDIGMYPYESHVHRKLDSITLFRNTAMTTPLKKVVLQQNPTLCWDGVRGKSTLESISFYGQNNEEQPGYRFEYAYNPQWDLSFDKPNYNDDDFGFYDTKGFSSNFDYNINDGHAWSLTKITYPSGGSESYEFENDQMFGLLTNPEEQYVKFTLYDVRFPGQHEISFENYKFVDVNGSRLHQGGARVKKITIDDGMGNISTKSYAYELGMPTGVPPNFFHRYRKWGFYTPAHRGDVCVTYWMIYETYSDGGSTKRTYTIPAYTKYGEYGYQVTPGSLEQITMLYIDQDPYGNALVASNEDIQWGIELENRTIGKYGSEITTKTVEFDDTFGYMSNAYTVPECCAYFGWMQNQTLSIIWGRYDVAKQTVTDKNLSKTIEYEYNTGPKYLSRKIEYGSKGEKRITDYTYAHEIPTYADMIDYNMLRQRVKSDFHVEDAQGQDLYYSSSVTKWKEYTLEFPTDIVWRPYQTFTWNATAPQTTVPQFNAAAWAEGASPGPAWLLGNTILDYDYYGNILRVEDVNGIRTRIDWPLTHSYAVPTLLVQDETAISGTTLTKSLVYDPLTLQVTSMIDQNNKSTFYEYDDFGRLSKVRDHTQNLLMEHDYYFSLEDHTNFNPQKPNRITTKTYRRASDFSISTSYYDGLGRNIQTQQQLGSNDIVTAMDLNMYGQVTKQWKPYILSTGHQFEDEYDGTVSNDKSARRYYDGIHGGADCEGFPYSHMLYDRGDEIKFTFFPGEIYHLEDIEYIQTTKLMDPRHNKRYMTNKLWTNSADDVTGYEAETLRKTEVLNENFDYKVSYSDKFGNTIKDVIYQPNLGSVLINEITYAYPEEPVVEKTFQFIANKDETVLVNWKATFSELTGCASLKAGTSPGGSNLINLSKTSNYQDTSIPLTLIKGQTYYFSLKSESDDVVNPNCPGPAGPPMCMMMTNTYVASAINVNISACATRFYKELADTRFEYDGTGNLTKVIQPKLIYEPEEQQPPLIETNTYEKNVYVFFKYLPDVFNEGEDDEETFIYNTDEAEPELRKMYWYCSIAGVGADAPGSFRIYDNGALIVNKTTNGNFSGYINGVDGHTYKIKASVHREVPGTMSITGDITYTEKTITTYPPPPPFDTEYLVMEYAYNTLGQIIKKASSDLDANGNNDLDDEDLSYPDIEYKYDKKGNLRFEQDANHKQMGAGCYVYNKYDALGRVIETGEYSGAVSFSSANANSSGNPQNDFPTTDKQVLLTNKYDNSTSGGINLLGRVAEVTYTDPLSLVQGHNYYSYNDKGLIEWIKKDIPGLGVKRFDYSYNLQGQPESIAYQPGQADQFYCWYYYDELGRLYQVKTHTQNQEASAHPDVKYIYNAESQAERVELGGNTQGVDYRYSPRSWLTAINALNNDLNGNPNNDGSNGFIADRFKMIFGYDNVLSNIGSVLDIKPQYAGNISWVEWKTTDTNNNPGDHCGYGFSYDGASRLTNADFSRYNSGWSTTENRYDVPEIKYDRPGNILSLNRFGYENSSLQQMDQLTYNYNLNRLTSITDAFPNSAYSLEDAETTGFGYDANGNVITESAKEISKIIYDYRNLPLKIELGATAPDNLNLSGLTITGTESYGALNEIAASTVTVTSTANVLFETKNKVRLLPGFHAHNGSHFNAMNDTQIDPGVGSIPEHTITYRYDESGQRIYKETSDGTIEHYVGDAGGETFAVYENQNLQFFNLKGADNIGKYVKNEGYYYYLKDHLGNIRVTVNATGNVKSYHDYYPFGLTMGGRSSVGSLTHDKYRYSGKELDEEYGLNWSYFGARYYDPAIGRFLSVDPLAANNPSFNPFHYCSNNPFNRIDPTGNADKHHHVEHLTNPLERKAQWEEWASKNIQNYQPGIYGDCSGGSGNENNSNNSSDPGVGLKVQQAASNLAVGASLLAGTGEALKQTGVGLRYSSFLGNATTGLGRTVTILGGASLIMEGGSLLTGEGSLSRFAYHGTGFGASLWAASAINPFAGIGVGLAFTGAELFNDYVFEPCVKEIKEIIDKFSSWEDRREYPTDFENFIPKRK